jgi:hypothetical protein
VLKLYVQIFCSFLFADPCRKVGPFQLQNRMDDTHVRGVLKTEQKFIHSQDEICTFLDLHDDIMFHIISFTYGSGIGDAFGYNEPISELFRQLSYVSKSLQRLCLSYVQQTPLDFFWGADGVRSFSVVCIGWRGIKSKSAVSFTPDNITNQE